jgi:hypothetical protein
MLSQERRTQEAIEALNRYIELAGQKDPKAANEVRQQVKALGGTPR